MPGTRLVSAIRLAARIIILEGTHPEVGAFPADKAGFDPSDVQPGFGQRPGRVFAAGPQADHHHVCMLWFVHAGLLPCVASHHAAPARSGIPFRGNSSDGAERRGPGNPGRGYFYHRARLAPFAGLIYVKLAQGKI